MCRYGAKAMAACAVPALMVMMLGQGDAVGLPAMGPDARLAAVWAGLLTVNALRSFSIWVPYKRRTPPFEKLKELPAGR